MSLDGNHFFLGVATITIWRLPNPFIVIATIAKRWLPGVHFLARQGTHNLKVVFRRLFDNDALLLRFGCQQYYSLQILALNIHARY